MPKVGYYRNAKNIHEILCCLVTDGTAWSIREVSHYTVCLAVCSDKDIVQGSGK